MAPSSTAALGARNAEVHPALVRLAARRLDAAVLVGAVGLEPAVEARARRFHREEDRRRFLAGRVLARSLVADLLHVPGATVTATASCPDPNCRYGNDGSHGEPRYFHNGKPVPLIVSFSRCGGWLAAAAAETPCGDGAGVERIGIDLDDAAAPAFAGAELEDVMATEAEKAAIAAAAFTDRPRMRAQLWVRKEAVLKARGQGLRIDPRTIDTLSSGQAGLRALEVGPEELGLPANLVLAVGADIGSAYEHFGAIRLEFNGIEGPLAPGRTFPA